MRLPVGLAIYSRKEHRERISNTNDRTTIKKVSMAQPAEQNAVTIHELLVSSLAQSDALVKLLNLKDTWSSGSLHCCTASTNFFPRVPEAYAPRAYV
jgi:hypothetical protein